MSAANEAPGRRMQKKLEQRDRRIAGMQRRIHELEAALARNSIALQRLPVDVERAVQRALCNVRMIPVLGVAGSDRIVEVRAQPTPQPADRAAVQP